MSEHEAAVHWGNWHTFAYCKTCGWEGTHVGLSNASVRQRREADQHQHDAARRVRRAFRWRWLTRTQPTVHLRSPWGGQPPTCCGKKWADMCALDQFTDDAATATCPDREVA